MKQLSRNNWILQIALALCLAGGITVFSQQQLVNVPLISTGRPAVRIVITGSVERDKQTISLDQVKSVNPGETLNWTIASKNEGDGPAMNYSVVGEISKGTVFVPDSTTVDGTPTVTFSIDNGETFSTQPTIEERQADGSIRQVPAPISMYTQVRYEWPGSLAANTSLTASYRVRVK